MELTGPEVYDLFPSAHRLARRFKGWEVELCGIVNAKSGRCPEDCAFCAQSAHHRTDAPVYGLQDVDALTAAARESTGHRANRFGIVTSGTCISEGAELDTVCEAVRRIAADGGVSPCASLGILSGAALSRARDAGLTRLPPQPRNRPHLLPRDLHHPRLRRGRRHRRRRQTARPHTCSGGIFGLGESRAQRVEMAMTLRELGVDSVPLNFLVPVNGTRLEDRPPLDPLEAFRSSPSSASPPARDDQGLRRARPQPRRHGDWIFYAGADGMMVGISSPRRAVLPPLDLADGPGAGLRPRGRGAAEIP